MGGMASLSLTTFPSTIRYSHYYSSQVSVVIMGAFSRCDPDLNWGLIIDSPLQ